MERSSRQSECETRAGVGAGWWGRGLALFLIVVGARFWLIERYSTAMPYWDQWDGIGDLVLKPFLAGRLDFHAFFAPHNEHRIVLSRLLSLAIFMADGQWDNLLECVVNTLFVGFSAVCLTGVLNSILSGRHQRLVFVTVGLYFALPFGWENTLSGFQSQNYFLILFSVVAVWGLGCLSTGSWRWWLGLSSLVLACLSMASGFLAAVAGGAVVTGRLVMERRRPRVGEAVTVALCVVVTAIGWLTRVEVQAHASLRVEGASEFVLAMLRFMAWPAYRFPLCGLLAVVPTVVLAVGALRRFATGSRSEGNGISHAAGALLAIDFWVLLQTAAMAYGRGGHSVPPACRYMDLLALGPLVNLLAWAVLVSGAQGLRRRLTLTAAAVWTALLVAGLWTETDKDFRGWLPFYRDEVQRAEQNLQGYLATGDAQRFLIGKPPDDLPYPDADRLIMLLDNRLRMVLPSDLRLPLTPKTVEFDGIAFQPGGHPRLGAPPALLPSWNSDASCDGSAQGKMLATFASETGFRYLRFSFAGDLGDEGLRFSLRDQASGQQLDWHPSRHIGEHWHTDYLTKPGREFTLEAVDENMARWFAFSAPVEVGFWSYWAGYALRHGGWIMAVGIAVACFVELTNVFRHRRIPA